MATNPMLQAVMLFQHHQTTTPFMPVPGAPTALTQPLADMAKPKEEKPEKDDTEENDEEENEEEQEGEEHAEEH